MVWGSFRCNFIWTTYLNAISLLSYGQNGTVVHQGQPIGVEGWTGNAGHRYLHLNVQKLPGTTEKEWKQRIMTYIGESVPFDFIAMQNNKLEKFDMTTLQCEYADIPPTIDYRSETNI